MMSVEKLYQNDPTLLEILRDLLGFALAIIRKTIAGEEKTAQILFLVTATYLTQYPLHSILQANSGLGKTHIADNILKMFPQDDILKYSRTTKTWADHAGDTLDYRILYLSQLRDQDKSDSLQILLTEHGLMTGTVEREGTKFKTVTKTTNGHFSMISTTVYPFEPQMATRVFTLNPDESPEQTARIISLQMRNSSHPWEAVSVNYEGIRTAISWLKDCGCKEVVIPFAELMRVPIIYTRARRDWQRLEGLTKCLAMTRQTQREILESNSKRYVVAEWCDYLDVLEIAGGVISQTLVGLTDRERMILDTINDEFAGTEFDVSQLRERIGSRVSLGPAMMKRLLAGIAKKDYIEQTRKGGGQSKQNLYRLVSGAYHNLPTKVLGGVTDQAAAEEIAKWRSSLSDVQWHRYEGLSLVPVDKGTTSSAPDIVEQPPSNESSLEDGGFNIVTNTQEGHEPSTKSGEVDHGPLSIPNPTIQGPEMNEPFTHNPVIRGPDTNGPYNNSEPPPPTPPSSSLPTPPSGGASNLGTLGKRSD